MALVIDRTTFADFVGDTIEYLAKEDRFLVITEQAGLSAFADLVGRGVPRGYWKIVDGDLQEMDANEKSEADAVALPLLKDARIADVERRTEELTSFGFEFPPASGVRYSLDITTRTLLLGMVIGKDALTYPVVFNSRDQRSAQALTGPDDVIAFYGTALLTVKALEDSGTELKQLIRAAASKAELDAIVDGR